MTWRLNRRHAIAEPSAKDAKGARHRSTRFEVKGERKDDIATVTNGTKRYAVPDTFLTGG